MGDLDKFFVSTPEFQTLKLLIMMSRAMGTGVHCLQTTTAFLHFLSPEEPPIFVPPHRRTTQGRKPSVRLRKQSTDRGTLHEIGKTMLH